MDRHRLRLELRTREHTISATYYGMLRAKVLSLAGLGIAGLLVSGCSQGNGISTTIGSVTQLQPLCIGAPAAKGICFRIGTHKQPVQVGQCVSVTWTYSKNPSAPTLITLVRIDASSHQAQCAELTSPRAPVPSASSPQV